MAERKLQVLLKKIMANGDIDHIFFKSRAKDVMVDESGTQTLADIASKVNNSADGATKVEDSATNGNIKIDGVETNVYEHPSSGVAAGTYNSVTVDDQGHVTNAEKITDWTGTVSGNTSNATNTITQATNRENLTSGEKLATSLGKIMKYFADLGNMAFTSNVGTANLDSTLTTFYNAAITSDNVTESTSITEAGWVADARALASIQNQINTINSNMDGKADTSHGNHVPTTQTANNAIFLRNDNTWQTVTPANIGAATSEHNHDASNITSGTLPSGVIATNGTDYTTSRLRNIALVTSAPSSLTHGCCAFVYS